LQLHKDKEKHSLFEKQFKLLFFLPNSNSKWLVWGGLIAASQQFYLEKWPVADLSALLSLFAPSLQVL
jgi:hypothetical protein